MRNDTPVIGVLGGMGPRATVVFLQKLVDRYRGRQDSDVPRLIVDFQTRIPSRSRHVLFGEASPVSALKFASDGIVALGADFVAIPCNSACALLPIEFFRSGVNLNIIDIAINDVRQQVGSNNLTRVLILAGPATIRLNTYGEKLRQANCSAQYPDEAVQLRIEGFIDRIKRFGQSEEVLNSLQEIVSEIYAQSPFDAVILACTELEELPYEQLLSPVPIISSSKSLVEYCFTIAGS